MKQTSIEWLDRWFRDNPEATHEEGNKALQQAKQMHKEEVIKILNKREDYLGTQPSIFDYLTNEEWFEQYYQETYGGNK